MAASYMAMTLTIPVFPSWQHHTWPWPWPYLFFLHGSIIHGLDLDLTCFSFMAASYMAMTLTFNKTIHHDLDLTCFSFIAASYKAMTFANSASFSSSCACAFCRSPMATFSLASCTAKLACHKHSCNMKTLHRVRKKFNDERKFIAFIRKKNNESWWHICHV